MLRAAHALHQGVGGQTHVGNESRHASWKAIERTLSDHVVHSKDSAHLGGGEQPPCAQVFFDGGATAVGAYVRTYVVTY